MVTPIVLSVVASRNGTTGTAEARLWDLTNSLEVGYISYTSDAVLIYNDNTLANLPSGEAVFEIQVKKAASGDSKVRLHSVLLR